MKDYLGIQRKDSGPDVTWFGCKIEMKLALLGDLPRATWHIWSQSVNPFCKGQWVAQNSVNKEVNYYVFVMMMMKIVLGTLGI